MKEREGAPKNLQVPMHSIYNMHDGYFDLKYFSEGAWCPTPEL